VVGGGGGGRGDRRRRRGRDHRAALCADGVCSGQERRVRVMMRLITRFPRVCTRVPVSRPELKTAPRPAGAVRRVRTASSGRASPRTAPAELCSMTALQLPRRCSPGSCAKRRGRRGRLHGCRQGTGSSGGAREEMRGGSASY
jgi:hypothetical protein